MARRICIPAALALAVIAGCGGDPPAAGKPAASAAPAAARQQPPPVKDLGLGMKPQRGDASKNPPKWPLVEFEPAVMDFGVLPPGGTARGTTKIWNVGPQPLRILKSITSCGCTAAEDLGGRVIPPGGHTEFTTAMTMKSGLGDKKEKISIVFEGYRTYVVQFFTAEVSLPVRLTPPHLAASRQDPRTRQWVSTMSGQIEVKSLDGKPFRILRVHGAAPEYVGFNPATDPPQSAYTIRWDLSRFGNAIPWYWVIETDRPDAPVVDARIQHVSTRPTRVEERPWEPKDQRLLVGLVSREEPFEITTKLEYDAGQTPDPNSASVSSQSPFLRAELVEAQADERHVQFRIRLTPTASAEPGLLYAKLDLYASGYGAPLRIIGRIVE
ncbi:MAG: DUF1573 domain-containing protein [Planctomycetota bacterium]|jgi:hypothetical protein